MFPIPWNKAYRKKDGGLTIIDDMFVDAPELQEEIDAIEESLEAIDGRLDTAEDDIDALETSVGEVEDSITPINQSGTESTVAIESGKYFYLGGILVKAKTAIAIGDTFTENTNYEVVTAGGLNTLALQISELPTKEDFAYHSINSTASGATNTNILMIYNKIGYYLFGNFLVNAGPYNVTLEFNNAYYLRLQTFSNTDIDKVFSNASSLSIGEMLFYMPVICQTYTGITSFANCYLIKENSNQYTLISDLFKRETSGTLTIDSSTIVGTSISGFKLKTEQF